MSKEYEAMEFLRNDSGASENVGRIMGEPENIDNGDSGKVVDIKGKIDEKSENKWLIKDASKHGKITYKINETAFVNEMLTQNKMYYIHGKIYDWNGLIPEGAITKTIQSKIEKWVIQGQAQRTKAIYDALCLKAYYEPPMPASDEIHFKNISFRIVKEGLKKIESPEFIITRINHDFNRESLDCARWDSFLGCLFEDTDILTVQEYIGYCFLATTKAQKALFIKSGGGEGKSVLISVLQRIFNGNYVRDKVQSISDNKFKLATLENKLVFFDDDLNTVGLTDTGLWKEIITNTGKMTIEEKGKDSRPADIFIRYFCIGNNDITSLFDHSDAFYDRLIPLTTKGNKFRGAKNENVNLIDELSEEIPAIITWALNGLLRLHNNGYKFTLSQKTVENINSIRLSNDSITAFFHSEYLEAIDIEKQWAEYENYKCFVSDVEKSYLKWCEDNSETPRKGFARAFKQVVEQNKNIKYLEQLVTDKPKRRGRGYSGIRISDIGKPKF